jgi:hypothetical protein
MKVHRFYTLEVVVSHHSAQPARAGRGVSRRLPVILNPNAQSLQEVGSVPLPARLIAEKAAAHAQYLKWTPKTGQPDKVYNPFQKQPIRRFKR